MTIQQFSGKTAIVTGSSLGIGKAIAERLAAEGATVILNGRNAEPLQEMVAAFEQSGWKANFVVGSVSSDGIARDLVEKAIEITGRIDLVVNNVGISPYFGPLLEADRGRFEKTMLANTWPAISLVQQAVAGGLGKGGAVLNISTIGARQVQPDVAPYAASKAALDVLTRTLARELGRRGIRVNGIAPGLIRTRTSAAVSEGGNGDREAELLPLGRLGEPEDVANAAAFLLSDNAGWITGETLVVDGGRLLVGDEPHGRIGAF